MAGFAICLYGRLPLPEDQQGRSCGPLYREAVKGVVFWRRWMYERDGDWQCWPEKVLEQLEQLYATWIASGSPDESFELSSGGQRYLINFAVMSQTNANSKKERQLRREEGQDRLQLQQSLDGNLA